MATHNELHRIFPLWIRQVNRGVFLAKVRAESARTMARSRRDRKLLVRPVVSEGANCLPSSETLIAHGLIDGAACQNIGRWACVTQHRTHHCSVKVKGAPAKPQ